MFKYKDKQQLLTQHIYSVTVQSKKHFDMLNHLGMNQAFNRQTDRWTD